jgi:hypothetical protein
MMLTVEKDMITDTLARHHAVDTDRQIVYTGPKVSLGRGEIFPRVLDPNAIDQGGKAVFRRGGDSV